MRKTILKAGFGLLLAANVLLLPIGQMGNVPVVHGAETAQAQAEVTTVKGKISNISQKAKTLALSLQNNDFFLLKFTDDTKFEGFEGPKDMKVGEAVAVSYVTQGNENIAKSVKMVLATLPPGVTRVATDELETMMAKNDKLVVIDSRPKQKYDEFHIPGAISIPFSKLAQLGDEGAKLLAEYKDKQLVFYCGGTSCTMSPKSAGLAVKWGHKDVKAYIDGIPAWKKSGRKINPSIDFVAKGNIVLIDLRDRKIAEGGTIPRSYSIPLDTLEDAEDALPKSLGAPLYIFGENDQMVKSGVKILKEIGYKNIVPYYGALDAWVKAGKDLQKGPVLTATDELPINWQRTLGDGEISISDFTKSLDSDLIKIIDARTPAEFESGHFPGSTNIPLEEMKARMAEIPRDKFIVVHCKTGGRGEIGYRMLKEAGYSVKFLNAECECSTTGQFEIW